MIRSFDFDGDDVIWFSRRLTGYFGRLERHGDTWTLRRFPAGQYPPADSWIVHRDSRGYIWRGSTQGYQVAEPDHLEPGEWLALTPRNGLSSTGECLRCLTEDSDGNIWLGGSQGITRVKPDSNWFRAPAGAAPIITRITAGRRQWFDPASMPATLPTGTPVEIDFAVVDATPFRSSAVRYRLLPDRTQWSLPADATARVLQTHGGDHTLEVAYAGDGQPEIRRWQVHVAASSTWMLPLSLSFGITGAAGAVWLAQTGLPALLAREAALPAEPDGAPPAVRRDLEQLYRPHIRRPLSSGGSHLARWILDHLPGARPPYARQRGGEGAPPVPRPGELEPASLRP